MAVASFAILLSMEANPQEIKSIKAWIGDANVVANSGMTNEQIVAGYEIGRAHV